jgi:hypothetical protein
VSVGGTTLRRDSDTLIGSAAVSVVQPLSGKLGLWIALTRPTKKAKVRFTQDRAILTPKVNANEFGELRFDS